MDLVSFGQALVYLSVSHGRASGFIYVCFVEDYLGFELECDFQVYVFMEYFLLALTATFQIENLVGHCVYMIFEPFDSGITQLF